jgi:hypothetical protein
MPRPVDSVESAMPAATKKEGPGRYRVGDFAITRETRDMWRVVWIPKEREFEIRGGVVGDAFTTLRDAVASVREEIAMEEAEARGPGPGFAQDHGCGEDLRKVAGILRAADPKDLGLVRRFTVITILLGTEPVIDVEGADAYMAAKDGAKRLVASLLIAIDAALRPRAEGETDQERDRPTDARTILRSARDVVRLLATGHRGHDLEVYVSTGSPWRPGLLVEDARAVPEMDEELHDAYLRSISTRETSKLPVLPWMVIFTRRLIMDGGEKWPQGLVRAQAWCLRAKFDETTDPDAMELLRISRRLREDAVSLHEAAKALT